MTQEEIIKKIIEELDWRLKLPDYVTNPQYKSGFFNLFQDAYKNKYCDKDLTVSELRDFIVEWWIREKQDSPEGKKKLELMTTFLLMWNEWKYALDNYDRT